MKNSSDKNISKQDYLKYLKGELTGKKAHELEKTSLSDPFDADALEGMHAHDAKSMELDLNELQSKLNLHPKRKTIYLRVAASIALLLSLSIWLLWPKQFPISQLAEKKQELIQENPASKKEITSDQENEIARAVKEISAIEKPKPVEKQIVKPIIEKPEIADKEISRAMPEVTLDFDTSTEEEKYPIAVAGQALSRVAPLAANASAKMEIPQIAWEVTQYFTENNAASRTVSPAQPPKEFEAKIQSILNGLNWTKKGQLELKSRLSSAGEITEIYVQRSYSQSVDSIMTSAILMQKNWLPSSVDSISVDSEVIFKITFQ